VHRQATYHQPGTGSQAGLQSQRSSTYWGNNNGGEHNPRYSNVSGQGGYGPPSGVVSRDELTNNEYGTPPMRHAPRTQPDINRVNGPPGVPGHLYPGQNTRSKDTLNTGNSSGSDQWNNSTNPTSEEGSIERAHGVTRTLGQPQFAPPYNDGYGSGYSDEEQMGRNNAFPPRQASMGSAPPAGYGGNGGFQNQYSNQGQYPNQQAGGPPRPPGKDINRPPAPPAKGSARPIMSLNSPSRGAVQQQPIEQRSSWFKKRFSRGGK